MPPDMTEEPTLKEKISQMFISKNPVQMENIEKFIEEGIGGFMIGKGGEIISSSQKELEGNSEESLRNFVKKLKKAGRQKNCKPLFLAIDGEGGDYFNRLKEISDYKSPRFYGEKFEKDGNLDYFTKEVEDFAKLMKRIGLNMNFAPLMDVAKNGYKGYVAEERILVRYGVLTKSEEKASRRSYSDKKETVEKLATEAHILFKKHGIISTLKHFPTYGILDIEENPHFCLPVSKTPKKKIKEHLELYENAFERGATAIMTGHIVTALDKSKPASLSEKVHRYIRKKMNFSGLVVSHDLKMGAVKKFYGERYAEKAALSAVKSNDIILVSHPETFFPMRDCILDAAKRSQELRKKINKSYERILTCKGNIGLI